MAGGSSGPAGESSFSSGVGRQDGDHPGEELNGKFFQALGQQAVAEPGLSPSALCRAAVQVLPVDGAGLSTLVDPLRIPLGSSSGEARTAEEIQTSLGVGPCLTVAETQVAMVADLDNLAERWPLYGSEMESKTPFRSAASVPLRNARGSVFAALDLYAEAPDLSVRLDLAPVDQYVAPVMAALLWPRVAEIAAVGEVQPAWYAVASTRRRRVWVAIGMTMGALRCTHQEALDRLRAYAYSHDTTVDNLAKELTDQRLTASELAD